MFKKYLRSYPFRGLRSSPFRVLLGGIAALILGISSVVWADMEAVLETNTTGDAFSVKEKVANTTIARFRGDGLVGIGTANPAERLEVTGGNVKISTAGSGVIFPDGTKQTTAAAAVAVGGGGTVSGTVGNIAKFTSANAVGDSVITESAGNVGIGTAGPTEDLHVASSTGQANIAVDALSTSVGSSFRLLRAGALKGYFYLNNAADDNVYFGTPTKDPAVTFASTGNVGIGTTAPAHKLHVHSTPGPSELGIRLYLEAARGWDFKIKANDPRLYFHDFNGAADRMVIDASGNVGIGTTVPSTKLQVAGDVSVMGSGNVGIGTIAATERLDVVGNIKASGTVVQGSSRELKRNISRISTREAMETVKGLEPVKFEYKADDSGEEHLGFIAEDVPNLVAEQDHKHLSPMDLTAILTKVVQEQQRMLQKQQEEIRQLKEAIGL